MDYLPPQLVSESESLRKVKQSTISLTSLFDGRVVRDHIEHAFSREGSGAALIKLDAYWAAIYEMFYRLQWQLCTREFDHDLKRKNEADVSFAALDKPVRQLLVRCGVSVARIRKGLKNPMPAPESRLEKFLQDSPLTAALGRPLAANRQEFHPSVSWLIEQEKKGTLGREEIPEYAVVADFADCTARIMGRVRADETRLLALYREWKDSTPDEKRSHGNKYNGDVYYGAFRGRTHVDSGTTMTVLFGAGELRDQNGFPVGVNAKSRDLGGTLIVASPGEESFVSLPYRLPCGSPYVVVFFEEFEKASVSVQPMLIARDSVFSEDAQHGCASNQTGTGINTDALGWAATVHGVRRIENEDFSRGQTVLHLLITDDDFME